MKHINKSSLGSPFLGVQKLSETKTSEDHGYDGFPLLENQPRLQKMETL